MAKQLVSPVERHVEKAVLGITAILLIGVVAKFFVTSPNQLVIDGVSVTPATIDEKIALTAEAVRLRIRNAEPTVDPRLPLGRRHAGQRGDHHPAITETGPPARTRRDDRRVRRGWL